MSDLSALLERAKRGDLAACQQCPWSPVKLGSIAFGASCREHGVDYNSSLDAVSVQVTQDPGNTTPEKTGRLCSVHNSQEPRDLTARNGFSLWKAAVARQHDGGGDRYLSGHYWTNAIMHGAPKESRSEIGKARKCCSSVLRDQIEILKPKVTIALGGVATDALYDAGFLSKRWPQFRDDLSTGPYEETQDPFGSKTFVYCTYHTSAGAVNRGASSRYSSQTEQLLARKLEQIGETKAAQDFLSVHSKDSARGRGMRLLLLHWLRIGDAIRSQHAAYPSEQ